MGLEDGGVEREAMGFNISVHTQIFYKASFCSDTSDKKKAAKAFSSLPNAIAAFQ